MCVCVCRLKNFFLLNKITEERLRLDFPLITIFFIFCYQCKDNIGQNNRKKSPFCAILGGDWIFHPHFLSQFILFDIDIHNGRFGRWRRCRCCSSIILKWIAKEIIVTLVHGYDVDFLIFELFHHRTVARRCKIFVWWTWSRRGSSRIRWLYRSSLTWIFRACHYDEEPKESCERGEVPAKMFMKNSNFN